MQKKQNKDLTKLFNIIEILAEEKPLEPKYKDHNLGGNYKNTRECHIEPNWLLIYQIKEDIIVLIFYRLGTHSELFK